MPPKKATSEQYKALVDLVSTTNSVRYGKGTPEQKKEAWETISRSVNAIGGVEKDADGWKKAFTEMKSHIKAKIRAKKALNEVEKTCADITGLHISCTGVPNVPELGTITESYTIIEEQGNLVLAESPFQQDLAEKEDEEKFGKTHAEPDAQAEPEVQAQPEATKETTKPSGSAKKRPPKSTQSTEKQKTSTEQYEMYINFKKLPCKDEDEAFVKLCLQLNCKKRGAHRSPANWKRIFSEWEKKIKANARRIRFEQEVTGGGIFIIEILTNLEKQLLEVLSKILIFGHLLIKELGFTKKTKKMASSKTFKIWKAGKKRLRKSIELHHTKQLKNSLIAINNSFVNLNKALLNLSQALTLIT